MLKIFVRHCGEFPDGYVNDIKGYFALEFEEEWLTHDFVKRVINEIDDTTVNKDGTLYNETLGAIIPNQLSSGAKALIMIHELGIKVNGDRLGDNCLDILLELSEQKDVYMTLHHIPRFPEQFTAEIVNSGLIIHTFKEFVNAYVEEEYDEDFNKY